MPETARDFYRQIDTEPDQQKPKEPSKTELRSQRRKARQEDDESATVAAPTPESGNLQEELTTVIGELRLEDAERKFDENREFEFNAAHAQRTAQAKKEFLDQRRLDQQNLRQARKELGSADDETAGSEEIAAQNRAEIGKHLKVLDQRQDLGEKRIDSSETIVEDAQPAKTVTNPDAEPAVALEVNPLLEAPELHLEGLDAWGRDVLANTMAKWESKRMEILMEFNPGLTTEEAEASIAPLRRAKREDLIRKIKE